VEQEGATTMKLLKLLGAGLLFLGLTSCGPGQVDQATNSAIATATTLVPPGGEATAAAVASDPTVAAMVNAVNGALSDPATQMAVDTAFQSINNQVTVQQGQALTLSALSSIPDVTNYKMTIVDAPAGAAASKGQVIKEASNGNISLNADEYSKYFTASGDYKIRLDLTTSGNSTASHEFTVTMP
jgi:hypothetical protein